MSYINPNILEEDWDSLGTWGDQDTNDGVSEIDPAGQLHLDCTDLSANGQAWRVKDIGSVGSGNYYVEFKFKGDTWDGHGDILHGIRIETEASPYRLLAYIGNGFESPAGDGMIIYDGSSWNLIHETTWNNEWHTIVFYIHNSQADCDIWIDKDPRTEGADVTDADVTYGATDDGAVRNGAQGTVVGNGEYHIDHMYIGDETFSSSSSSSSLSSSSFSSSSSSTSSFSSSSSSSSFSSSSSSSSFSSSSSSSSSSFSSSSSSSSFSSSSSSSSLSSFSSSSSSKSFSSSSSSSSSNSSCSSSSSSHSGSHFTTKGDTTFEVGDVLRIKDGIDDEWMEVKGVVSSTQYVVDRDLAGKYALNNNPAWTKGATVVNYGVSGDGGVYMTASEGNAPYLSVFDHAGSPWTTINTRLRLGNLNGFLGYASDLYGIAIGETNKYLKYDPTNGLRIKGTITITGGSGIGNLTDAGGLAIQDTIGASDCDITIISGGKIITGLLTADNIVTGTLNASLVTVSNLVVGTNVGIGTAEDSAGVTTIIGDTINSGYITALELVVGTEVGLGTAQDSAGVTTIVGNTITSGYITALSLVVGTEIGLGTAQDSAGVTTIIGNTVTTSFVNALSITADSVAAENITGTTITGKTIQTAASNQRVVVSGTNNNIAFYGSDNDPSGDIEGRTDGALQISSPGEVSQIILYSSLASMQFKGDIIPMSTGDYDLGQTTHKFQNLYLSADAYVGGGITLGGTRRTTWPSGGEFSCTDLSSCSLTNLGTKAHGDLTGVTTSQHHVKYTDANARSAVTGTALPGSLFPSSTSYTLGSSSYYWGDFYFHAGGEIYVGSSTHYIRLNQRDYNGNDAAGFDNLGDTMPQGTGIWDLGGSSNHFNAVYSDNYPASPIQVSKSGIDTFKKITKINKKGIKYTLETDDLPAEFKMKDKKGEEHTELKRTVGLCVQAIMELVEKVEKLENK